MKTFYYAKIQGYLPWLSENKHNIAWYVNVNRDRTRKDGDFDKDGNKIEFGTIEAVDESSAMKIMREMFNS
jgi:hypothetical protein